MDDMFQLLWQKYRIWADTSAQLKRTNQAWRRNVLILTIIGTLLATLGPHVTSLSRLMAIAGTIALALATYFGKELLDARHEEQWTRARAAAEAFKSEACKYLVQVPPYDGPDRSSRLKARIAEIGQVTKDQTPRDVPSGLISKDMPAAMWDVETYIANRLDDQIAWYRAKASRHTASMKRGRAIALILGAIAVVLSAVTGATTTGAGLAAAVLGVVTTAAGSIGGYFQAGHFEAIALKYRETADALETLKAEYRTLPTAQNKADLVQNAEAMMQAENAAWLTQLTTKAGG